MKKVFILIVILLLSVSANAQQRSVCEIVPVPFGKFPVSMAKYENGKMEEMQQLPADLSHLTITPKEMTLYFDGKNVHEFKYTSTPKTGIEYLMWDDISDKEVNVFIVYIQSEKEKYYGVFIRYKDNLEYVFTIKGGTQL